MTILLLPKPENHEPDQPDQKSHWPWILVVALVFTAGLFAIGLHRKLPVIEGKKIVAPKIVTLPKVNIAAQTAIVIDVQTGRVLYEKNPNLISAPASLTKLLTALVANKYLSADTNVIISQQALAQTGDSGLVSGESWPLDHLISFTLVNSSNDGAAAIAEALETEMGQSFVGLMNSEAATLGMASSIFANPTGLDFDSQGDGSFSRTTAKDIATMMAYIFKNNPGLLQPTTRMSYQTKSDTSWHSALNTNHLVTRWPGVLGSKTGYTDMAGGNLAVIFDAGLNQPVVAVVLGSTVDGRFSDMETLMHLASLKIAEPEAQGL